MSTDERSRGAFASRRNVLTALTSAVAAVALAAAVAGRSCSVDDTPTGVVRELAAAASADDPEALYDLLGPETRARLHRAAKKATDLAGGAMRYSALDMISIGRSTEIVPAKEFILKQSSDSRATVEIIGVNDERELIDLVNVDGHWRIELPAYGTGL